MNTTTDNHSRIGYFTSPSEMSGEACFAILGGSGNIISAAYNHAGIFVCNVPAVGANTFHVNCLNACSTPQYTGTAFPVGTIFTCNGSTALPSNACPLFVWI